MKKLLIPLGLLVVVVIALIGFKVLHATPKTYVVLYTDKGFSPASLNIPVGATVTFKNTTNNPMVVASDPYPTHVDYPEFVAPKPYGKNEVFVFTFTKGGTFGYDNDLQTTDRGFVQVTDPAHLPISVEEIPASQQPILDYLLTLFIPGDPNSIFTVFDAVQTNPTLAVNCHELGHALGHRAYEMYGFSNSLTFSNPNNVLHTPVSDVCSGGYIHGILEEVFDHQPELTKDPKSICANIPPGKLDFNLDNCYHGVGHALMFAYKRNITKSIDGCRTLGDANFQMRCFRGIYMELFFSDTEHSGPGTLNWDPADPLQVCKAAPSDARPACFMYVPFGYQKTHNDGVPGVITMCTTGGLVASDTAKCLLGTGFGTYPGKDFRILASYTAPLSYENAYNFYTGVTLAALESTVTVDELTKSCSALSNNKDACLAALAHEATFFTAKN